MLLFFTRVWKGKCLVLNEAYGMSLCLEGVMYAVAFNIQHFAGSFALQRRPQISILHAKQGHDMNV